MVQAYENIIIEFHKVLPKKGLGLFTVDYCLSIGVALEVFNKCIKVGKEEGACVVTLYYEFLDDTYANWNMEMEMLENFGDAYTLVQLLIKDGKANTFEKELDKKKNHPLSIMVRALVLNAGFCILKVSQCFANINQK